MHMHMYLKSIRNGDGIYCYKYMNEITKSFTLLFL